METRVGLLAGAGGLENPAVCPAEQGGRARRVSGDSDALVVQVRQVVAPLRGAEDAPPTVQRHHPVWLRRAPRTVGQQVSEVATGQGVPGLTCPAVQDASFL